MSDAPPTPRPMPVTDDLDTGGFFEAARGELAIRMCNGCDAVLHVPVAYCYRCGSWENRWQVVAGTGRLYSWTVVAHQVHPPTRCPTPWCSSSSTTIPRPGWSASCPAAPNWKRARPWRSGSRPCPTTWCCPSGAPSPPEPQESPPGLRHRPRVPGGARLGRRLRARGGRAARPRPEPRLGHERPVAHGADPAAQEKVRGGACGPPPRPRARRARLRPGEAGAAQRDPRPQPLRADRLRLPGAGLRQRRDPGPLRHRRAQGALPRAAAAQRDRLGLLDDRAPGRLRPHPVHRAGRARRRRVGDQRGEVVLVARQLRVLPHPAGGHRPRRHEAQPDVDVRRPGRDARRQHPAATCPSTATTTAAPTPTSATRRPDPRRPPPRRAGAGLPRRPDPPRRRPHPPRHAHHRTGEEGARHDVRAGAVAHRRKASCSPASSWCRR